MERRPTLAKGITVYRTANPSLAAELGLHGPLTETHIGLGGPSPDTLTHPGMEMTQAVLGLAEIGSILVHPDGDGVDRRPSGRELIFRRQVGGK